MKISKSKTQFTKAGKFNRFSLKVHEQYYKQFACLRNVPLIISRRFIECVVLTKITFGNMWVSIAPNIINETCKIQFTVIAGEKRFAVKNL